MLLWELRTKNITMNPFALLKPAAFQPVTKNNQQIKEEFSYWRLRIAYSIFLGYAVFYFTRKSFTFIMDDIQADLGFSNAELGLIGSTLYIAYGISKFLSGAIADRSNPRYFMAFGLMLSGVLNICFGFVNSLWAMLVIWGLNGWFQAWGWPACCKQLNYWFELKERGLWYSICSTSHNVGGFIIPLLAGFCAVNFGWQYAMIVPGIISIIMGLVLIERMRDVPRSIGLPTIEEYRNSPDDQSSSSNLSQTAEKEKNLSFKEIFINQVLSNSYVWVLAIAYFFVYIIRTGINDWTVKYLVETRLIEKSVAVWGVSWFELGGLIGMLIAGWASDYYSNGNRIPSIIVCSLGLIVSLFGLLYPLYNHIYWDIMMLALIGAFVFGPQMIVGLAAAEFVDKRAASCANGFVGTLAYFGAAFAGYPVGVMIDNWGWTGFIWSLVISSILTLALVLSVHFDGHHKFLSGIRASWRLSTRWLRVSGA